MRRYLGIAVGLGLLLAVLSVTSAGPVLAQGAIKPIMAFIVNDSANPVPTRNVNDRANPVPTRNIDEPGRVPYQVEASVSAASCAFNGVIYTCDKVFPPVPAAKRLIVEHLSTFQALSSGTPDVIRFLNANFATLFWVQPTFSTRAGLPTHFFLDRPVRVYYEPTTSPTVRIQTNGAPEVILVTLHGYLVDAVN